MPERLPLTIFWPPQTLFWAFKSIQTLEIDCLRLFSGLLKKSLLKTCVRVNSRYTKSLARLYESTESYCCHFDVGIGIAL